MKCPFCGFEDSKVIDSRPADAGASIRRRRQCISCEKRFTTYEVVESTPIVVIKRDGSRQSFDRNKIINGLVRACEKRPVTLAQMEKVADDIHSELQSNIEREVSSAMVGSMVMDKLRDIDEVSYVRFASVYRSFTDVGSFLDELSKLMSK